MDKPNNTPDNELLQLCYKLYKLNNNDKDIIYSYYGFVNNKEYENYYSLAIKKLRIEKLNKICSKQVIK